MNNINFLFKELDTNKYDIGSDELNLQQMIDNLNNLNDSTETTKSNKLLHKSYNKKQLTNNKISILDMDINTDMNIHKSELTDKCTIKELLKICDYYDIEKNIKITKCKKQDIISIILCFESLSENEELVQRRYKLWHYMDNLFNDKKMKKYIIWT